MPFTVNYLNSIRSSDIANSADDGGSKKDPVLAINFNKTCQHNFAENFNPAFNLTTIGY